MAYTQDTHLKAQSVLQLRREKANSDQDRHKVECYAKYPRLAQIQQELNRVGLGISKAFLAGGDVKKAIEHLGNESILLQEQKEEVLLKAGLPKDYLSIHYTCENCKDTGVDNTRICNCYKSVLKEVQRQRIQKVAPIDQCTFGTFDVDYYTAEKSDGGISPKELAQSVFNGCVRYCANFTLQSANLLLMGGTGLGKTHLSLAIANSIIDKGYGVVYGTAGNILGDLEATRFNRTVGYTRYEERELLDCDLLVIDDLGTEFVTQFTVSCLYNIINSRLLSGHPTIINTNLCTADLERTYDQRITSRLTSDYTVLRFIGSDVRRLKKNQG